MVNSETGDFIFHDNKDKINTEAKEKYIKEILSKLKAKNKKDFGNLIYEDEKNGNKYLASYNYMKERGWVFILTDPYEEVFSSLKTIRIELFIICAVGIVILTIFTSNIIRILIKSLQKSMDTLGICYKSIDEKTGDLYKHSDYLVRNVTDNTATIEELSASLENTDDIMEMVKAKVAEIEHWMQLLLDDMLNSVKTSETLIENSGEMAQQAQKAYTMSQNTFEETKNVVGQTMQRMQDISEINKMADGILDIAKQTNLLSINAELEAVRAGEAGRGFSVVSNEIGELARTTTQTASDILQMCENINESVEAVGKCFDTIIDFMEQTVMQQFRSFINEAHEYSQTAGMIRKAIVNMDNSSDNLKNSLKEISESIYKVKEITNENGKAIGMIAGKNTETSDIADQIQKQSDSNKELVEQLDKIISDFEN